MLRASAILSAAAWIAIFSSTRLPQCATLSPRIYTSRFACDGRRYAADNERIATSGAYTRALIYATARYATRIEVDSRRLLRREKLNTYPERERERERNSCMHASHGYL